jgi:hypothetical protein
MKNIITGLLLFVVSVGAHAGVINIDTSKWLHLAGPSNDRNTGKWIGLHAQRPEKKGNTSGTLVSDFQISGDFLFNGFVTPTTVDYDDNDIIGLVFGWQDEKNHYRLGWTQTQRPGTNDDKSYRDITGSTGLFLVREVDGLSSTLYNINDWFWEDDVRYKFEIKREKQFLNIIFGAKSFSLEDMTFATGRVGVYTESQTARFEQLNVQTPTLTINQVVKVNEPGISIFLSGLMLLFVARWRSGNRSAIGIKS